MKFKSTLQGMLYKLPNNVTNKIGRSGLLAKKHSPTILFGVGVIGFGATVVLACRATLKLDLLLEESQKKLEFAQANEALTTKDRKREIALVRGGVAIDTIKLYGPAVFVGVASVFALTGSHVILSKRNLALTAAYATVEQTLNEYRRRIVEEYGAEKEREIRFGVTEKEIVEEEEDGPVVKKVKRHTGTPSGYAKVFDENNKHWKREYDYNQMFISSVQSWANNKLNANGHLFLNEVYDMLGMERTKAGQIVGWVKNRKDGLGDGYVDFGVFLNDKFMGQLFVNGDERSVWLDFNVDGDVLDLI